MWINKEKLWKLIDQLVDDKLKAERERMVFTECLSDSYATYHTVSYTQEAFNTEIFNRLSQLALELGFIHKPATVVSAHYKKYEKKDLPQ